MRRTTKRLLALGVAGCLAVVALAGCSTQAEESTPAPTPEPEEAYGIAIGTEDAGTDTILMTNDTGQAITAVAARTVDAAVAPDAAAEATAFQAMPFSGEAWEPGQLAALFVGDPAKEAAVDEVAEATAAENADVAEGEPVDVAVAQSMDLQLTLADGTIYVLHDVDPAALAKVGTVTLGLDADANVAYLTYVEDGAQVSTLAAETQAAEAEKALSDAAAAAGAAKDAATDVAADATGAVANAAQDAHDKLASTSE